MRENIPITNPVINEGTGTQDRDWLDRKEGREVKVGKTFTWGIDWESLKGVMKILERCQVESKLALQEEGVRKKRGQKISVLIKKHVE